MSDLFFTSDEHIGHQNIIKFCKRPFKDIYECRDELIKRHNAKVSKGSRVYHLGDMFWRTFPLKDALDYMHALNGQHYFIWGNHDELIENNEILRNRFIWTKDLAVVDWEPRLILCHYAMLTWRGSHRGDWQLFGHTHGALETKTLSLDVGVDAWNFEPVSIEEIAAKMEIKKQHGHADPMMEKIRKQVWDKTGD